MTCILSLWLGAVLCVITTADAQQPRDIRKAVEAGAGAIGGIITDAADGRPLRRARVTLNGDALDRARTAITADDGTFSFDDLPIGRYSLSAAKEGHVSMNFGAARPDRPGRHVVLTPATSTARVNVVLPRGGVITGTVLNPDGEPAPGVSVVAMTTKYDLDRGQRRLSNVPNGTVTTDDRGVYRIFGLPAGTYFVAAIPQRSSQRAFGDAYLLSESEVRAALAEVRASRTSTRPGMPAAPPVPVIAGDPPKAVALTPIFYPGTALQARAAAIVVGAGEVRHGIDVDLEYVATATIEGIVTVPSGMRVQLLIADSDPAAVSQTTRMVARPGEDGRFAFRSIRPGSYTISARAFLSDGRAMASEANLWGETEVIVAGEDITGVTVRLQPALTIAGRLEFESTTLAPPIPGAIRIPLPVASAGGSGSAPLPTVVVDGSRFSISGVIPGTYRFSSVPRGVRAPIGPWWLKSLTTDGRELLDAELELRQSTHEAVITFSDRSSELSGSVRQADGSPLADGFVVVFATEPRFWFHNSRRIAGVRLPADGRYVVRNLPAGEYHIAVSADIGFNEWFDPEALRALAPVAMRVPLNADERRVQDLTVR